MSDVNYDKDSIPAGTIVVTCEGWEDKLFNLDDMNYTHEFGAGQLFNAVAQYYGKTQNSYGTKWPKFRTPVGEISKAYKMLEEAILEEKTDFGRLVKVCDQLGEDVPVVIEIQQK